MSGTLDDGARELPVGLVTFCLTDIVDSTPLWDRHPGVMPGVIARHDELVEVAVARHGGHLVQQMGEGDSTVSVFPRPASALLAAIDIDDAMEREPWPSGIEVRVRAGVHAGTADIRDGRYFGASLNRAARLRGLAGGRQIVVSLATAELVRDDLPAGMQLQDAGEFELKGLARAERVFVLKAAGDAADPRLAGAPVDLGGGSVPVAATRFVGRASEMAALADALGEHRLVTIAGPGGSGKTRLALEVAQARSTATDEGIVIVDLAAIAEPELVPQAVGAAAGMQSTGDATPAQAIARIGEVLASRRLLIVLDNCEHVLDAAARVADALLRAGGEARILATSQAPLGVAGERVYPLRPLEMPEAASSAARDADAVKLFVERALDHDATFELTDDDVAPVVAICRALDGMPLAIELAAAHIRMLSPKEILSRLGADALSLLERGPSTAIERQRTLRASIDWSVRLLSPQQEALLTRLAVFSGGFTLAAAEAVCASDDLPRDDIFGVLSTLVERSLVARRVRGGTTRYWLLETIRRYAEERLAHTAEAASARWFMRREPGLWAIAGDAGAEVRVRDSIGLRHLSRIAARPGHEVHVLDLVAQESGGSAGSQPGVPALDDEARRAYRRRLDDLAAEVDDAKASADPGRAERAEAEIEALTRELTRGYGISGQTREIGGAAERARVSVTKAIRRAIDQLGADAPTLAEHLRQTIRTGVYCGYEPGDGPYLRVSAL